LKRKAAPRIATAATNVEKRTILYHGACRVVKTAQENNELYKTKHTLCKGASESECCNTLTQHGSQKKDFKCRTLIGDNREEVHFQIDTGSSVNILPIDYAVDVLPYEATLSMLNMNAHKLAGMCRLTVRNPKNGKKYSVPFVVCENDKQTMIGYKMEQMELINIKDVNCDDIASVNTNEGMFVTVFNGKLGKLPGTKSD